MLEQADSAALAAGDATGLNARWSRRGAWSGTFLLLLITLWAFAGVLSLAFVQDDFWLLQALERPWPNRLMLVGSLPDYLRPLPTFWWPAVNRALWDLEPWGYHATQLGLLLLTIVVLQRALQIVSGSWLAALVAAAVYALSETHQFTLAWFSGVGDELSALFLAVALWAVARAERGRGRGVMVGCALFAALLCKEHSIVLPVAFGGAVLAGGLAQRRPWRRLLGDAADVRMLMILGAVSVAYVVCWYLAVRSSSADRGLGCEPMRAVTVLGHSLLVVHPTIDCGDRLPLYWLLLPPALAAITVWLEGRAAWRAVTFALLWWVLPACIFMVSTRPPVLYEYYSHLSVVGLCMLIALSGGAILRRLASIRGGKLESAAVVGTAILLVVFVAVSAVRRHRDIAADRSPALIGEAFAVAAGRDIAAALAQSSVTQTPVKQIDFLDVQESMWWAMGKGAMVPVLFGGVRARFDGYGGVTIAPDARSSGDRLVMRQVGERQLEVVR